MLTATAVWKLSIILALLQVTSPEVLKCNFPRNFTSDAYSSSTTDVYDADLEIKLDYDHLEFYGYRDKKFISIRGKDVTVDMNGFSDGEYWPELVRVVFNEELTGHAEREPMDNATYSISNCRLVLLPTNDELLPSSMVARNRIRKFAETCLEHYMCQELQQINRQDFIEISSTRPFCFSPGEPDSLTKLIAGAQYKTELEFGEFEDLWNKMMDIGLNEGLKTASDEHGVLKLPNITQEFSTGVGFFASTFKIDFFQGKLRGLMDLRRQGNWKIIKTGQKFTLSVSIELPALEMEYPKYLAHAFFTVEGQLNVTINELKMNAAISIDYSQKPCIQKVEKIEITEMGEIRADFTGLGAWSISLKNNAVAEMLEHSIIKNTEENVPQFYCEILRP